MHIKSIRTGRSLSGTFARRYEVCASCRCVSRVFKAAQAKAKSDPKEEFFFSRVHAVHAAAQRSPELRSYTKNNDNDVTEAQKTPWRAL